jgi:hypothetical protein
MSCVNAEHVASVYVFPAKSSILISTYTGDGVRWSLGENTMSSSASSARLSYTYYGKQCSDRKNRK